MLTLYGLGSCDTCRKARQEIEKTGKNVAFRDVRKEPLTADERARFISSFGDSLVNRRSTTWRGLTEAEREGSPDDLISAHPTLMKRPVIDGGGTLTLGWDAAARSLHLGEGAD